MTQGSFDSKAQPANSKGDETADRLRRGSPLPRSQIITYFATTLFMIGVLLSVSILYTQIVGFGRGGTDISSFVPLGTGFAMIVLALGVISRRDESLPLNIREILGSGSRNTIDREPANKSTVGTKKKSNESEHDLDSFAPLNRVRIRIAHHIYQLRLLAFTNILIGALIASAGIAVIFTLFSHILDVDYTKLESMTASSYTAFFVIIFLPRASIVILIQIFAYFFLSMYRANLREVRYFQMELNDLELVGEAVQISEDEEINPTRQDIIQRLFALAMYRGDKFRAAVSSDEALETFKSLVIAGDIIDKVKEPFGVGRRTHEQRADGTPVKKSNRPGKATASPPESTAATS